MLLEAGLNFSSDHQHPDYIQHSDTTTGCEVRPLRLKLFLSAVSEIWAVAVLTQGNNCAATATGTNAQL